MAPSKGEDRLAQKSAAAFFADNRTIAGFDNVRPCLLTTAHRLPLLQLLGSSARPQPFAVVPALRSPASACTLLSVNWWRMGSMLRRASVSCPTSTSLCELHHSLCCCLRCACAPAAQVNPQPTRNLAPHPPLSPCFSSPPFCLPLPLTARPQRGDQPAATEQDSGRHEP
jgi:hypothetical protein